MFHEVHELFARARGGQEGLEGQGEEGGQAGNGPALSLPTDLPFTIPSDPNDNNGPRTLGVIWLLLALAMALLSLRLWSKFQRQRGLWWDDYVIVASWFALLVDTALITKMVGLGYGKHFDQIKIEDVPTMTTLGITSSVFVVAAISWSKTSFGITLLRISHGWIKMIVWFIIISMNILFALSPILHFASCTPLRKVWNPLVPGTCWDLKVGVYYDIFVSAYSAAMDFILAFLPILLIKDLQMDKKEKIGIAIAMSMGIFAGTTAIVKCIYLPILLDIDFSYKGVELSIWGSAEVSTTIIAASIPILRVFLREIRTNVERYHGRTGDHMTADNPTATRKSRLRTGNNTIVAATTNNMERGANVDDSSDRSILGHGKIMQKREINIETHSRSDGDETGYEMGRMHVDHAATYRPEN